MTCPHCGAYSPKNTANCNRCGRRLPLLESQREQQRQQLESGKAPAAVSPEHEGYGYGYRQPEQTKLGIILEKIGTFLDELLLDDPARRNRVISAAVAIIGLFIILIAFTTDCSSCYDRGGEEQPVVSVTDISGSDVSGSDLSGSDVTEEGADASSGSAA